MRWLSLFSALWPAAAVWLLIVLPQMAWSGRSVLEQEWLQPVPLVLRVPIWVGQHVWPYSKIARAHERWDQAEQSYADRLQLDQLRREALLVTSVRIMPARLDLGLAPRSQAEADSWLAAQPGRQELMREPWHGARATATHEP